MSCPELGNNAILNSVDVVVKVGVELGKKDSAIKSGVKGSARVLIFVDMAIRGVKIGVPPLKNSKFLVKYFLKVNI